MPELRYDLLSGSYALVASERARRPNEFKSAQAKETQVPDIDPNCPFCIGNETETPPEVFSLRDFGAENEPGWRVRIVPNKFPALRSQTKDHGLEMDSVTSSCKQLPGAEDASMYWRVPGIGAHEVVVESNKHNGTLGRYTPDEMSEIFQALKQRHKRLHEKRPIKYVQIFRNWGPQGGASLLHPHFQIIGLPFIPPEACKEISRFQEYEAKTNRCLMCDYIERETEKGLRVAAKNRGFIALCPFASRHAFETLIVPRNHSSVFSEIDDEKTKQLADIFSAIFRRYEEMFSALSHNVVLHSLPAKPSGKFSIGHWHIHVYPRLNVEAGLEKGAGVWINPTPPELAALQFNEKG